MGAGPAAAWSSLRRAVPCASLPQVHVIKYPRLEDLSAQLQGWKPNFVYVYGGVNGDKRDLEKQAVSHLSFLVDAQGACVHACAGRGRRQGGGGSLQARRVYTRAAACWTFCQGGWWGSGSALPGQPSRGPFSQPPGLGRAHTNAAAPAPLQGGLWRRRCTSSSPPLAACTWTPSTLMPRGAHRSVRASWCARCEVTEVLGGAKTQWRAGNWSSAKRAQHVPGQSGR